MRRFVFSLALIASLLLAACGSTATTTTPATQPATENPSGNATNALATETNAELSGSISITGSTTVQPLAEKLAEQFMAANPNVSIEVTGGGSSVGVKAAGEGTADIGNASREISADEKTQYPNMKVFVIARDGIAIIVDPNSTLTNLTVDQVRDIFSGKINNWKDVGGPDAQIFVVSREEGSGTRTAFEEMVMGKDALITENAILQNSNGAVRTAVATTPNSIGYLSFGYLDNSVKAINLNGVAPTEENASNGTYPVVRPLNMLTNGEPQGVVKAFLDYVLGPEGQALVRTEGYIPVK